MTLIVDKTWKKPLEHFCGLGMWVFVTFLNIKNNNFRANEQHNELHNLTHLSLGTNASSTICQIIVKSNILIAWERGCKGQDFLFLFNIKG
jgi:hypothetical protein